MRTLNSNQLTSKLETSKSFTWNSKRRYRQVSKLENMRALSKIVNTSNSLDDDLETIKVC